MGETSGTSFGGEEIISPGITGGASLGKIKGETGGLAGSSISQGNLYTLYLYRPEYSAIFQL